MPLKLTPAFEQWFKSSKAVNASGKPRVVYHGTRSDIEQVDMSASAIECSKDFSGARAALSLPSSNSQAGPVGKSRLRVFL